MQKACWVLIIFLIVALGSCLDNDICLRGADNALVIEFKKLSDGLADTVTFLNIEATGVDSVFYKDFPEDLTDTLFVDDVATVAVNPYAESTFFRFNDFRGEPQTLEVGYKTEVRFVSEECGSERLQYNLKVIGTSFDSVRVVRNSLNKGRSTNIEIYH
jgi:hypothetical protein